jgi:hypothetical protein
LAVNLPASRLRRPPRVRRDPIDISPIISLVAVEAAEAAAAEESLGASLDESRDADQVLAALEARQAAQQRCVADPRVVWATDASAPAPRRPGLPGSGISAENVRVWMDQVEADLRKVRARIEYLTAEQARLDEQQRLMAQLLTTSSPL